MRFPLLAALLTAIAVPVLTLAQSPAEQTIDLPTGHQLTLPIPGSPQRTNSLPLVLAVSPDGRYVVSVNAGYGTVTSHYKQSLAVLDTNTNILTDFPDDRTLVGTPQTLYAGLVFSADGQHLYASLGSTSTPVGDGAKKTGSCIVVYTFTAGKLAPERLIPLPLQPLARTRRTKLIGGIDGDKGVPFPAGLALAGTHLLVANNLSDDVLLLDPATGTVVHRFDLSETDAVPGTFPVTLAVTRDGKRAFVSLWNSSEVAELDLVANTVLRKLPLLKPTSPTAAGTHPCALLLTPDDRTLYVALSNRDTVAALNVAANQFAIKGYFDTRLPGQTYFGAEPEALALSPDGSRLFVADAEINAVAVFNPAQLTPKLAKSGMVEPLGFLPTEWMPTALARSGSHLFIATAKGHGTGPNGAPQPVFPEVADQRRAHRPYTYIGTLLYGSLATLDLTTLDVNLPAWTQTVLASNRMKAAAETIPFASGANPIKHVIYIIKENRTYDQILGDLTSNGKPVGNGDPSLTMYGAAITPNEHKLALQFGVLDNFFDSGEVSGDGHVWSNAAIGSDYLERAWQQSYRGSGHTYDFEGVVAEGYPLLQHIPDINEPASGYLWGNLAAHGKTYLHFGEFISTVFCDQKKAANPQEGPVLAGHTCTPRDIPPGAPLPPEWGGSVNKWPWPIPLMSSNIATKPELVGHFAPEAPDFNLRIPDQIRVDIFSKHLATWIADKQAGKDTMPAFVMLRLGNDHTAGTTPGGPTPRASVADNDLAVGRAVELISHSPFWEDTAFFILEDDAQDGGDHVDAHRSIAFIVSKYSPHSADGSPFVETRFLSTVSVVRTMETLLGLPPMNNNDAFASLAGSLFSGPGDQPPYTADTSNRDNNLIYTANTKAAPGAKESSRMDFRHADRADAQRLNVILWKDSRGTATTVPASLTERRKNRKKDADD